MRSSLILAMLLALAACSPQTQTTHEPSVTTPIATASGPRIILPDGSTIRLEIAADDETRQQGLMYRDRLAEDAGMLFLFAKTEEYPFWMKNTLIPLDMIWIDEQKRIVHIAHDVPPCRADPCPNYPPNAKSRYVLELAGGVAAKHRLADGNTLRFEGLDSIQVR